MSSRRHALDRYDTPDWMTQALLARHADLRGRLLLDPCCGAGRMAALLKPRFEQVRTNDIDPGVRADSCCDARSAALYAGLQPDWVITNPPFNAAALIVFRAIQAARVGVAMLLRCTFLEPVRERAWLADYPPTELISLPRSRWKGPGSGTDSAPVWWYLWRRGRESSCPVVSKAEMQELQRTGLAAGLLEAAGSGPGKALERQPVQLTLGGP